MEKKSRALPVSGVLTDPVVWLGLFAATYLAVLPMAETIAVRYAALLAVLISLVLNFQGIRDKINLGLPVLLWAAYLLAFPIISNDHVVAWQSLRLQWGMGLLAMFAGAGVAAVLNRRFDGAVFWLGAISAVPVLVHLVLFASWAWQIGFIPWGYWGRETHHADLGYAAGHAVILLSAWLVAGKRENRSWAVVLIGAALISTMVAQSRAGLAFAVLGVLLVFVPAYLAQAPSRKRRYVLAGLAALLVAGMSVLVLAVKEDPRWRDMLVRISAGFLGNAIQIECEGTASVESTIISMYGPGKQAQDLTSNIRAGDGARPVVLRAGLQLALKHPWGSDGSRQAFQKLLKQECPNPAISMAHAHNGWVDTMLAIGWVGAALYLWVLLYFFRQGLASLRSRGGLNPWGLVLAALPIFWMVRGFADSVYRDHMLEMQGFMLAYALVASRLSHESK